MKLKPLLRPEDVHEGRYKCHVPGQ